MFWTPRIASRYSLHMKKTIHGFEFELVPCADLQHANLQDANLLHANLLGANLQRANLQDANLRYANLQHANLRYANLLGANLRFANLAGANLQDANLQHASLAGANLLGANLQRANLQDTNLQDANLQDANLSQTKGLLTARDFLKTFDADEFGVIVYKALGNSTYPAPFSWRIKPNAVISETVNPDRGTLCGCGVNVASLEWVKRNYPKATYWKCRIAWRDLADVVVPFGTDGKFRCSRLRLLEVVK